MFDNTLSLIKSFSERGRIRFKKHALIRAIERRISIQDIEDIFKNCQIIYSYPEDKPSVSYLVSGVTKINKPLHIVIALDDKEEYIWIITIYKPDKNKWDKTFTKRL